MKYFAALLTLLLFGIQACRNAPTGELVNLLDRVVSLNITRNGYTLGKKLTQKQKKTARHNTVKMETRGTTKFRDNDLYIVVENETGRVVILYEQYEPASKEKIKALVGELFLDFGEPTVFAHDKVIYWAYGPKGKVSENDYTAAKDKKEAPDILATIKLNSSLNIMDKETTPAPADASLYYIISSQPVLERIGQKKIEN